MISYKNNIHVNGYVQKEIYFSESNFVLITVGVPVNDKLLQIQVITDKQYWENFKKSFPKNYNSISVSGKLKTNRNAATSDYIIQANSISCFHNLLGDNFDETEATFHGIVKLKKKFEFGTNSKLYLKKMVFETVDIAKKNVTFEAMALRSAAPYFDTIEEGEEIVLKADYTLDKNGNPPYWRIKCRPELVAR